MEQTFFSHTNRMNSENRKEHLLDVCNKHSSAILIEWTQKIEKNIYWMYVTNILQPY